jgi:hypothetical protein
VWPGKANAESAKMVAVQREVHPDGLAFNLFNNNVLHLEGQGFVGQLFRHAPLHAIGAND